MSGICSQKKTGQVVVFVAAVAEVVEVVVVADSDSVVVTSSDVLVFVPTVSEDYIVPPLTM